MNMAKTSISIMNCLTGILGNSLNALTKPYIIAPTITIRAIDIPTTINAVAIGDVLKWNIPAIWEVTLARFCKLIPNRKL